MGDLLGFATEGGAALDIEHGTQASDTGLVVDNVLIEGDRWGSSGYYPATVLERDGARAFPAGTQVYLDHAEIGKDSAKGLIGELQEDARYVVQEDGKKVLRAPMKFYESGTYNATWIKERAKRLGISIRSGVKFAAGTMEGRTGKIVTAFTEGISVDVVARAGAGGKFGTIKESADPLQAQQNEEEGHKMTPEELKAQAGAFATAVAEALRPSFEAITTAVGEVKDSVAESKVTKLTGAQVSEKLAKAKLPAAAESRVWAEFEAKNGDVEAFVENEIKVWTDAVAEAKRSLGDAGNFVDEDENGDKKGAAAEAASTPSGWTVSE